MLNQAGDGHQQVEDALAKEARAKAKVPNAQVQQEPVRGPTVAPPPSSNWPSPLGSTVTQEVPQSQHSLKVVLPCQCPQNQGGEASSPLPSTCPNSIMEQIEMKEWGWGGTPLHQRLQRSLSWWLTNATPQIVSLIQEGIKPQWVIAPDLSLHARQGPNLQQAESILQDYEKSGAVKRVGKDGTSHLLPWFLISKPEDGGGTKWRFISDCREINEHFQVKKFCLAHMQEIFPVLQKGHWAAKIDLKDAYFHLPVNEALKPFLRHLVGNQVWEYQAGPFGLNVMPQLFQSVMHTFEKRWRRKGIQVYIYLDDILMVAPTPKILEKHLQMIVEDLLDSGFKINLKKSVLEPTQKVNHLGFVINLADGKLQLVPQKIKGIRKELGKFLIKKEMSKRQMSAILGQIRANLLALPFLRAFTSSLASFLQEKARDPWDSKHFISPEIKEQLKEIRSLLESWSGRPFPTKASRVLHSDSSTLGWGGIDIVSGEKIQEFWREQKTLHINVKEMEAAINTVRSLAKPGETIQLCVDNQVIYYYLQKGGGRKNPFNKMLQPFFHWLINQKVSLQVKWVPSAKCLADPLSRWERDRGDYSLDPNLFQWLSKFFSKFICLKTDMFASPGNKKLTNFCSRWPHWQASAVDALRCPLDNLGGLYANPPWSIIGKFLQRLREFPQVRALMVVPFWDSATWWPQLIKMKAPGTPCLKINPYKGLFTNCWGEKMPPPVAPLLSDLLRQILEGKQVQNSSIDDFLNKNPSLRRYQSGFSLLWSILEKEGIHPPEASVEKIADAIIQLFKLSPAQARNAYSGVLLLPGVGANLRFHPLLKPYKRLWNVSTERYGAFWDPTPLLMHLAETNFVTLQEDLPKLRLHLILVCRLLCLYRSADLANLKRTASVLGGVPYIKIKRKGQKFPKWERVVAISEVRQISPFHLLQAYVAATQKQGHPGGPVLLSLRSPFKPLTADAIGSLTKNALQSFGIPSKIFGAHSTRGAGVNFMKKLGLSSEEVCEIGKWKNVEAFSAHYQRLGAQSALEKALSENFFGAQSTSLGGSAEPEVSRTPPRPTERGGRDTEGEAQTPSEPTRPAPKRNWSALGGLDPPEQLPLPRLGGSPPRFRFKSSSPTVADAGAQHTANSGKQAALRRRSLTRRT